MKSLLIECSRSPYYWLFMLILGLFFEAVALYYQYILDEWPCVLCIHIRIWIAGMILLAAIALVTRPGPRLSQSYHLLMTLLNIGLLERSWQLLAVERGWIIGSCSMESGLPDWFALDQWWPVLFEIKTTCGYTPYVLLKISMAEILLVTSVGLTSLSLLLLLSRYLSGSRT